MACVNEAGTDGRAAGSDGPETQPVAAAVPASRTRLIPPELGRRQSLSTQQDILASRRSAIVTAAERIGPAVVSVNVVRRTRQLPRSAWDMFFMPRGFERQVEGLGSGFIVTTDGIVITNQHVTQGAETIVVTTRDGADYDAVLLGEDPLTDIAVLKIENGPFPAAETGSASDLVIGEWVIAVGNPYGYLLGNTEPSVTAGVVSALGRNLIPSGEDAGIYVGMIQTDAAINPGNSGGPLVNAAGEVVGVNSSIISRSGGSLGIGFAIPIERALRVADELVRFRAVRRAWVGLDVAGEDRLRDWKRVGGLAIIDVAPESPADRGQLRAGDVLISANGRQTRTFLDWEAVKLDVGPGDSIATVYRREGRDRRVTLIVEALPSTQAEKVAALGDMRLITVTPAIRQERGLNRDHGALIYEIGAATRRSTGLRQDDVILQINRQRIDDARQVREAFRLAVGSRSPVRVFVDRGGAIFATDFYVSR